MPEVTLQWSTESFGRDSAEMVYEVFGAVNGVEAVGLIPFKAGVPHPQDRALVARPPVATRKSPPRDAATGGLWFVRVSFVPQDSEQAKEDSGGDDPLKELPTYRWRQELIGVEVDQDIDGNPITNSAGEPFAQNPTAEILAFHLTVTRPERFYDPAWAANFGNSVNSDNWRIPGTPYVVKPGHAHCQGINPAEDYNLKQTAVRVQYDFEFRFDTTGFDLRVLDKGPRGMTSAGIARILDGTGQPIGEDVLLGGDGLPYDTGSYGIEGTPRAINPPKGSTKDDTGRAVFLKYKIKKTRPLSQLRLE